MNAKKVLVAIDHSTQAPIVFEQALEQAEGGCLMLVHSLRIETHVEANPLLGVGTLGDTQMYSTLQRLKKEQVEQEIQKVQDWLQPYYQQATARGIPTEMKCPIGEPGTSICDLARNWRADLIVLGRRGHHGIREVVLGSVSNYVLHHAPCSVLVVQKQFSEMEHPLDSNSELEVH